MSTLDQVEARGDLWKFRPTLEIDELPSRIIYVTAGCLRWINDSLANEPADRDKSLLPIDQVDQLFVDFILGRPMAYDVHLKRLDYVRYGTWEMKTADVRLFGYFYRRATFISVAGEMRKRLKPAKLYQGFVDQVRAVMTSIDLDPPPALEGTLLNDVL